MKTIRITLAGTGRKDVSDGTAMRRDGEVCELADADADTLVGLKLAIFVDGSSAIEVHAGQADRVAAAQIAARQSIAKQAMAIHDLLPAEVRQQVHEHGDAALEDYLASIPVEGFDAPKPKRRVRR